MNWYILYTLDSDQTYPQPAFSSYKTIRTTWPSGHRSTCLSLLRIMYVMKGIFRQSQQQHSLQSGPLVGTDLLIDAVSRYVPIAWRLSRTEERSSSIRVAYDCRGPEVCGCMLFVQFLIHFHSGGPWWSDPDLAVTCAWLNTHERAMLLESARSTTYTACATAVFLTLFIFIHLYTLYDVIQMMWCLME